MSSLAIFFLARADTEARKFQFGTDCAQQMQLFISYHNRKAKGQGQ